MGETYGIFVSDWTRRGDLHFALNALDIWLLAYRFGLYYGGSYRFESILPDVERYKSRVAMTLPVIILQNDKIDKHVWAIEQCVNVTGTGVIALDVEIDINGLDRAVSALIDYMIGRYIKPVIYTNHDFIKRYRLNHPSIAGKSYLWLAHYADNVKPVFGWDKLVIWQKAPKWSYGEAVLNVTKEIVLPSAITYIRDED